DIHASWQIQLHQSVNGFIGWINDVHQTHMSADLELVTRSLVDMRRTQDVITLNTGWQWNRTLDNSAGTLGGVNDFECRLVDQTIIESFQTDADFLVWNCLWCGRHMYSLKERAAGKTRSDERGDIIAAPCLLLTR